MQGQTISRSRKVVKWNKWSFRGECYRSGQGIDVHVGLRTLIIRMAHKRRKPHTVSPSQQGDAAKTTPVELGGTTKKGVKAVSLRDPRNNRSTFQDLVREWRAARGATSSVTAISILPAYQRIIGMGDAAVPLILAELKSEGDDPDHWFWALTAITGANPVNLEDQGDMLKMAESWLKWGEAQGYAR